jgi:hypothetical protein
MASLPHRLGVSSARLLAVRRFPHDILTASSQVDRHADHGCCVAAGPLLTTGYGLPATN